MKFILTILLFFILLAMLLGFGIVRSIFKLFFGSNGPKGQAQTKQQPFSQQRQTRTSSTTSQTTHKEKIFGKDEGEYVDFEEIKE